MNEARNTCSGKKKKKGTRHTGKLPGKQPIGTERDGDDTARSVGQDKAIEESETLCLQTCYIGTYMHVHVRT